VTYNIGVNDLSPYLQGHIIICGYSDGLEFFLETLRAKSLLPICVLSTDHLEMPIEKLSRKFSNVYHFKGSSLDILNLKNAGLETCLSVVILAARSGASVFRDSDAVITYKLVKEFYPSKRVLIEVADMDNIKLIE